MKFEASVLLATLAASTVAAPAQLHSTRRWVVSILFKEWDILKITPATADRWHSEDARPLRRFCTPDRPREDANQAPA